MAKGGLDLTRWNEFWSAKGWQRVIAVLPEAKRAALIEAGNALTQEVQSQISKQGVNDQFGRVRSWQSPEVGSGGGYVAVRAEDGTVTTEGGQSTKKEITRFLEHGHGVREPSGRAKHYEPRIRGNGIYVKGYLFYSWSKVGAERIAIDAAERCLVKWENAIDDIFGDDYMEIT